MHSHIKKKARTHTQPCREMSAFPTLEEKKKKKTLFQFTDFPSTVKMPHVSNDTVRYIEKMIWDVTMAFLKQQKCMGSPGELKISAYRNHDSKRMKYTHTV